MKYYYDLHIHSALSPCSDNEMTPNNIVNMAHIKGLNAIAISDHNTVQNVKATIEAAKKYNMLVVPAMEIETAEEVHVLSLFPSLNIAQAVEKEIRAHMPKIKNNVDVFGHQFIFDEFDNIIGEDEQMLVTATSLSIGDVFKIIRECGGAFIPAHIDKPSYSIISNLGAIPNDLNVSTIEISKNIKSVEEYIKANDYLKQYKVLRNSDAHYLQDISENLYNISILNNSTQKSLLRFIQFFV